MLTSLFYYGHYKPYLIRESGKINRKANKSSDNKFNRDNSKKEVQILLNRSLKTDVKKYANDIARNVNDLKESSLKVIKTMEQFDLNNSLILNEKYKETLFKDLDDFSESFNAAVSFFENQEHSYFLKECANQLKQDINSYFKNLKTLEYVKTGASKLDFDKSIFDERSVTELLKVTGENLDFFSNVSSLSSTLLKEPLSVHMNFKNLDFYYNYRYDGVLADSFKVIEFGMIVDVCV